MLKKIIIIIVSIIITIIILTLSINIYIYLTTKDKIIKLSDVKDIDYMLVLGAKVNGNKPSLMLKDRLDKAIEVYNQNNNIKIILSGDGRTKEYDEVSVMQEYLLNLGVSKDNIILDKEGLSTSNSIYNLKNNFKVDKVLIVTQEYHLYRALYVADSMGIECYGIASDPREYAKQFTREIREVLARDKDFIKCILKPEATFLGETIPVNGSGDITNDKRGNQVEEN